jgi:hypothetical protein
MLLSLPKTKATLKRVPLKVETPKKMRSGRQFQVDPLHVIGEHIAIR